MPLRVGQEVQEVLRRGDGELTPTSSPESSTTFDALDTIPGEGDHMNLAGVVQQLRKERDQAARTVQQLDAALAALDSGSYGRRTGTRRKISAAGRARIAAAQRARWAKVRGTGKQKQNVVSMPKKRTMSATARRRIAAAQRARWAKVKAAQKKSA